MANRILKKVVHLCAIASALGIAGCADPELKSIQGFAQGTTYTISYWSDPAVPSGAAQSAAQLTLDRIDRELSNYRDDSAIELFNRSESTEAHEVPASLIELVTIAKDVRRESGGCYDLTVRPLFELWGFSDEFRVPAPEEIAATLATVGMDKLTVVEGTHLAKMEPDLGIDVSSIAQGFSTAEIARSLEELGIHDYLVEVGGELLVKGGKPNLEPWRVAVERPLPGERAIQKIVEVDPGAPLSVITSGTYRHFYDQDDRRYSHILDARTGEPVQHDLLSVTVVHPDPTFADAWATALLCLGPEDALRVATERGLAVMLIEADGQDLLETYSPAFEDNRWRIEHIAE